MKHILLLASIFLFSACTYFVQICTFESDNVKLMEDDRFIYSDEIATIEYKINNEGPIFDFRITNNTEQDITIDISKSYFVYNKEVYDYAGRSTTIMAFSYDFASKTYSIGNSFYNSSTTVANTRGVSIAETQSIADELIIPAGCNRTLSSFPIDRKIYNDDEIVESVETATPVTITLTRDDTPICLTNCITLRYNNKEHKIINDLYVKYINVYPIPIDTQKVLIYNDQMHLIYNSYELWQ